MMAVPITQKPVRGFYIIGTFVMKELKLFLCQQNALFKIVIGKNTQISDLLVLS